MSVMARAVQPEEIVEQRAKGHAEDPEKVRWPDFHPETYCHRCGHPNVASWWVESEVWNAVMRGGDRGRADDPVSIVCPPCFTSLAAERGVHDGSWRLSIDGGTS